MQRGVLDGAARRASPTRSPGAAGAAISTMHRSLLPPVLSRIAARCQDAQGLLLERPLCPCSDEPPLTSGPGVPGRQCGPTGWPTWRKEVFAMAEELAQMLLAGTGPTIGWYRRQLVRNKELQPRPTCTCPAQVSGVVALSALRSLCESRVVVDSTLEGGGVAEGPSDGAVSALVKVRARTSEIGGQTVTKGLPSRCSVSPKGDRISGIRIGGGKLWVVRLYGHGLVSEPVQSSRLRSSRFH
jgi:hypothetical protein